MESATERAWGRTALAAVTAFAVTCALHVVFARQHVNPADEGFLWYGVQRTLAGDVPLRDFQSYEPGRYLWCALIGTFAGDGIVALRTSIAVFQGLGLFFGCLVVLRVLPARWLVVPVAFALAYWMFPRHKAFESAAAMMAVWVAVRLFEEPSVRRHALAGVAVGLATFLGRNHGLYCGAAFGLSILLLAWKGRDGGPVGKGRDRGLGRKLAAFVGGAFVGALPLLGMLAFVPGFAAAFFDSLLFFVQHGSNTPLAYPWPWRLGFEHLAGHERFALAAAFLLPPVVYVVGLVALWRTPAEELGRRSVLLGAVVVGSFYAHQASVRSDPQHLAQSIHPALLACLGACALVRGRARLPVTAVACTLLVALAVVAVGATNPVVKPWRTVSTERVERVPLEVGDDVLQVDPGDARYLELVRGAIEAAVPAEAPIFFAPVFSIFYPLFERRAPTWQIYFLWKLSEDEQRAIIRRLDGVDHALIVDTDPTGELLFRNTNPLVWAWFTERFEPVEPRLLPAGHWLLRRRP